MKAITLILLVVGVFSFLPSVSPASASSNRCPPAHIRGILKPLWDYRRPLIAKSITDGLTAGDNPYVLYDVQLDTNNLLESAVNCADTATIQELVDVYLLAYPHLKPNPQGYKEWPCSSSACPAYRGQTIEVVLVSSQFIYLLSRTANILAGLPAASLSSSMREFLQKYIPVIVTDHLHKWIADTTVFSLKGYNCSDRGDYNNHQFLNKLLNKEFGNSPTYCNAVSDTNMWIIAAAAEMLAADSRSSLITLTSAQTRELRDHVSLGTRLIQSRLTETSLTNFADRPVKGYVFDQGMWRDHPDFAYAGYTEATYPTEANKKISPLVGWDFSHSRRFVNVFNTLHDTLSVTGQSFPDDTVLIRLANQVTYQIFNKDFNRPLFTNFWDGTSGWYRVGYNNRSRFGYAPHVFSVVFLTGGYGLWGRFNPDIDRVMNAVWKVIDSTDPQVVEFRKQHYGNIYSEYQPTVPDWPKTTSIYLFQMLPTVITVLPPPPTSTPGDLNSDGKVNIFDYNLLVSKFGNPYTIFDYNKLVANYGK